MMNHSPLNKKVKEAIEAVYPQVVAIRRHLHMYPELSNHEHDTAALVYRQVKEWGLKPRYHIGKTGVTADLGIGKGKTIVLRADMDALPIQEKNRVAYKSQVNGVMHACGHDIHTACLLGAAKILASLKKELHGKVVFLFQPSEEVEPGGAIQMIRSGAFPGNVDAVFGLHVSIDHPTGTIGLKPGDDCSGVLTFDVTVRGKGGHGAMPERAIDPIVCACSMIMELQTLISRESPPFEPAVLTVGSFHSGTKRNIIPDEARFYGTIRTFSEKLQTQLQRRVTQVLKAVAHSFRTGVEVSFVKSYPPGYNDPAMTGRAKDILRDALGKSKVAVRSYPTMFAEDFTYYLKMSRGTYIHLGVKKPDDKAPAGLHSARFLPDETAMKTGIMTHCALALGIAGKN
ncbi:MAG: amidohydrolase [Chitinivibrionales bacterium]|nr:amidohydrolase [Chitinivibrionales bacterium]